MAKVQQAAQDRRSRHTTVVVYFKDAHDENFAVEYGPEEVVLTGDAPLASILPVVRDLAGMAEGEPLQIFLKRDNATGKYFSRLGAPENVVHWDMEARSVVFLQPGPKKKARAY